MKQKNSPTKENPFAFITENPVIQGMTYLMLITVFLAILEYNPNKESEIDNYIKQNPLNEIVTKITRDSLKVTNLNKLHDSLVAAEKKEKTKHELIITNNLNMQNSIDSLKREIFSRIERGRNKIYNSSTYE